MTNTTFYTLEDVRIEATLWCAKIGLGSDTTPVDRCERGMQSSRHEWNKRTLTADEAYEISLGDVLFATPSALLYAEISIDATYTPWVLPYNLNKEIRFYSRPERKRGNRVATQTVGVERRIKKEFWKSGITGAGPRPCSRISHSACVSVAPNRDQSGRRGSGSNGTKSAIDGVDREPAIQPLRSSGVTASSATTFCSSPFMRGF